MNRLLELYRGRDMYDENKTNNEIFAEVLIQIIENQIAIKEHLGIARCYDDCYYDRKMIDELKRIN